MLASQVQVFRTWFLIADCGQCGPRAMRMSGFLMDVSLDGLYGQDGTLARPSSHRSVAGHSCSSGDLEGVAGGGNLCEARGEQPSPLMTP